tara:strand:+ start:329 stop:595 length:267 start_codon:yes stop_codon:yes gene_type:complete
MTLTDNKEATICLGKAKVIKSEIKEIIGLSYPEKESDYLTIQMLDWDNKEIIIELSAYEWINWFDNKTLKRIGDSLNKIVTKKTSSKN